MILELVVEDFAVTRASRKVNTSLLLLLGESLLRCWCTRSVLRVGMLGSTVLATWDSGNKTRSLVADIWTVAIGSLLEILGILADFGLNHRLQPWWGSLCTHRIDGDAVGVVHGIGKWNAACDPDESTVAPEVPK